MAVLVKNGASMGSALPDPVKDQAALAPVPQQAIENKPAPGQTGPKGMAPRTTYSRVNTGSPPTMDAGGAGQKNGPNLGMQFLPAKMAAQRGFPMTTMQERPSLQDLVKASMAGTNVKLAAQLESARQERVLTKTASAPSVDRSLTGHVATEVCTKLADALGYIERQLLKEADYDLGPGKGPGALEVMQAESSETNIDAGQSGQATSRNQPPQTPALQPEKVQQGNAGTGLQTNDDSMLPAQPLEPIKNASGLEASNLARMKKLSFAITQKGHDFDAKFYDMKARHAAERMALGEEFGAHRFGGNGEVPEDAGTAGDRLLNLARFGSSESAEGSPRHLEYAADKHREGSNAYNPFGGMFTPSSHETDGSALVLGKYHNPSGKGAPPGAKEASVHRLDVARLRKLASQVKKAEDAINPAQISSPANVDPAQPPPGAAAAGEQVPAEPADVTGQKRLIQSNESAINYTKGEAKADPKKDVAQVLTEPPLSSATDKVLERAFDNTGRAGVKISSAAPGMLKSASQVGATRVLLSRLLKEASESVPKEGKDKRSTGMAPSTPQAATGANAATMGM